MLGIEAGSMDELRGRIWDYLYRHGKPQEITILAEQLNVTSGEIQQAVEHPWFELQDGLVAIALSSS